MYSQPQNVHTKSRAGPSPAPALVYDIVVRIMDLCSAQDDYALLASVARVSWGVEPCGDAAFCMRMSSLHRRSSLGWI